MRPQPRHCLCSRSSRDHLDSGQLRLRRIAVSSRIANRIQRQIISSRIRTEKSFATTPRAPCAGHGADVQSRYVRRPADLLLSGPRVGLTVVSRRFWCDAVPCGRRIFCEQFDKDGLARYGRRTQRLETIVHHLGLALGSITSCRFYQSRLMMPATIWYEVARPTLIAGPLLQTIAALPCNALNGNHVFSSTVNGLIGPAVAEIKTAIYYFVHRCLAV